MPFSRSFDGGCSAGRPCRCAWRARSRRSYTHDTCERKNDAKPSSEDAVVDVDVDRCIGESSVSNRSQEDFVSPKLHPSRTSYYGSSGVQPPQRRKLPSLRGPGPQLIAVEVQHLQRRELPDLHRHARQLIAVEGATS